MGFRQWIGRAFWIVLGRISDAFQVLGISGVTGMTGSFVVPAWAASASAWLNAYGPIAWVLAGFGGLFLFALVMLMWGRFQLYLGTKKVMELQMAETPAADPFAGSYDKKRLRLSSIVDPVTNMVAGKTFHGCDILGPVNFTISGGTMFHSCQMINVDHVEVPDGTVIHNGVVLHACTFNQCRILVATIIVPKRAKSAIPENAHWITA